VLGRKVQDERGGVRLKRCDFRQVFQDPGNAQEVVWPLVQVSYYSVSTILSRPVKGYVQPSEE
jgi:hypothetical protein